ncbi:hypothetical protein PROPHIGD54-1_33 [Mycobacterium phage prophiGD54-1]|nr:hypothetical protein PROPHIGD102-2_33 [Mycobacterium phage prophi102-2]QSM04007.1 hypothetical protein PROPHIGD54-1_33 [Mycobacterium phage prophiGD54-1]
MCGHLWSDHQGRLAPHCHFVHWPTYERGGGLCGCPEFTVRPRAERRRNWGEKGHL